MITIEIENKEYKIPSGWNDVNLEMFEEIYKLSSILNSYKSETEFSLDMFQVITGAPKEDLLKLTRKGFETLVKWTEWATGDIKPTNKKIFIIDGEEWMPLEDLTTLSMGDSISLELLIKESKDWELLTNILPVLIRPVKVVGKTNGKTKKVPGDFDANNYNEIKELFKKELKVADVFQLRAFFSNTEVLSSITTKATSVK